MQFVITNATVSRAGTNYDIGNGTYDNVENRLVFPNPGQQAGLIAIGLEYNMAGTMAAGGGDADAVVRTKLANGNLRVTCMDGPAGGMGADLTFNCA